MKTETKDDIADAERYRHLRDYGYLDGYVDAYESERNLMESEIGSKKYLRHCDSAIDKIISDDKKVKPNA